MTSKPKNIVVIDDSATSIALYERSVSRLSVELSTFQSPVQSLAYLEKHDADLVFLDMLMREQDGLSTLKAFRGMDRHKDTTVVIVTSKDYQQDRRLAATLDVKEYLLKPLRSQEIRALICKYTHAEETHKP